ncbi:MAG: flagellar hook-associated protein FlgK, partial [Cyanobacteria bacterium J06648_11]
MLSTNIANASTEGFARREISLSTRVLDGGSAGVQIDGVSRVVNAALQQDLRDASAELGYEEARSNAYGEIGRLLGTPGDTSSLTSLLDRFETVLLEASSRPDETARLVAVSDAARALVDGANRISEGYQELRQDADVSIARQIDDLNTKLAQIQSLNADIARLNGAGRDVTGLLDLRQGLVNDVSQIVPVREYPRGDEKVALVTTGGGVLLDPTAIKVDFAPTGTITADMTLSSGALSGLTINGLAAATEGTFAPFGGGTLAAAFEVRDSIVPTAQAELDAFARDLVERFEDPATDPARSLAAPGVFTDGPSPLDPLDTAGLATRLRLNTGFDPAVGGSAESWRDGIGGAVPAEAGDGRQILRYLEALQVSRAPSSTALPAIERDSSTLLADLTSLSSVRDTTAEAETLFARTRFEGQQQLVFAEGVDTDQELQKLLLVEQNYAANARVIQTIDE